MMTTTNTKKSEKQVFLLDSKKETFLLWDKGKMRKWKREEIYLFPEDAEEYLQDGRELATELIEDKQIRTYVLHNLSMFYGRDFLGGKKYNFRRRSELRLFIERDKRYAIPFKDAHFSTGHKQVCYGCNTMKYE